MIKGIKICGISDLKTLNYILNHAFPPKFIGFITNYEKSKRFVHYDKLKELLKIDKKQTKFVSVLVDPNDQILEKIKELRKELFDLRFKQATRQLNETHNFKTIKKQIAQLMTLSKEQSIPQKSTN